MKHLPMSLIFSLLGVLPCANAVEPLIEDSDNDVTLFFDDVLAVFGAEEEYVPTDGINTSYIPTLYYTPEKGIGGGLLVVGLYGDEQQPQPSSFVINSYLSENKSYGVEFENKHFFGKHGQRLYLDIDLYHDAAVYYGKGYDNGDNDDNLVDFFEQKMAIRPTFLTPVAKDFFVGIGLDASNVSAKEIEPDKPGNDFGSELEDSTSYGALVSATFDSRDNISNASRGVFANASAGWYHSELTGKGFGKYLVETATYHDLANFPGLLAWQVKGDFSSGDVPWDRLADLGGSSAMRGYIKGRYRDNQMLMTQLEYRLPIYWRVGMVFWGAAGSVADDISGLNKHVLASYGTGFRFKIKDKVNLRADIGVGENETAFYINVNEVF